MEWEAIRPWRTWSHENRILFLALGAGAPGVIATVILLWTSVQHDGTRWTVGSLAVGLWLAFAFAVRSNVIRPLQTLANVHSALRQGDFSFRARVARGAGALGELMREVNALSEMLREQRLGALEANALLATVMAEIDVAIFAFDEERRLRLVNRAAERLLALSSERLLGRRAEELELAELLEDESARTLEKNFAGRSGRWGVRRISFRQGGVPHDLVVITDLSQALREEERQAWQRLVRVLGHELNNSLAPICSLAGSLEDLLNRQPRVSDWEDDLRGGLRVIANRAEALSRFMKDYARLARLPKPQLRSVDVGQLIRDAVRVETRVAVQTIPGPEVKMQADPDQLQQLLINLIGNAADASLETGGKVTVEWAQSGNALSLVIRDEGPGIANPGNLFVPFFTTKSGGSGIGLILSRQIAEAHGGVLNLANRPGRKGCEARVRLPLLAGEGAVNGY